MSTPIIQLNSSGEGTSPPLKIQLLGDTTPYFDGEIIIEKAESVLGLRRFKDSVTPINISSADIDDIYQEIGFEVEPFEAPTGDIINGLSCVFDDNGTLTIVINTPDFTIKYDYIEFASVVSDFTITSTANSTVEDWLLANTEGVSV